MSETGSVIHWFRKGLRLHDNPSLVHALQQVSILHIKCVMNTSVILIRLLLLHLQAINNQWKLFPIFILDTEITKWLKVGPNRWRFLKQSLEQLDQNLIEKNSKLYVLRGSPNNIFPEIFEKWNVKMITFEHDIEPYSVKRDEMVESLAEKHNIKVVQKMSHTIFSAYDVTRKNGGTAPLTYQKFLSVVEKLDKPLEPLDAPAIFPDDIIPKIDLTERNYECPTLQELGVEETSLTECLYPGGETEALKRMNMYLQKKQWICKFEKPNTSPNSIEPSTTVLSPYLKFGCLSAKLFYFELIRVIGNSNHTKPPVSLIGQLMWREFYYAVAATTPNFDKMNGNKICCQIPWQKNDAYLLAWTHGKTGYPFIDAIMRQLRQEGWIHHLARHAVACFLTRGDLWISWEEGQSVFEELLLDADWALNAGNWMWLSASAFFHQFFRVYSPVAFGKKTDKNGIYIKKYVPELKKFPTEYIYEPWTAPMSFQKSVGCIIGKDYPTRIVVHEKVYKENISKMSLAYKMNKSNNETSKSSNTSGNKIPAKKKKL